VLRNPKYTGYQVWNRGPQERSNRLNAPDQWVWSEQPAHPAIVSRDEYQAVQAQATVNARYRQLPVAGNLADRPRTVYLYRGRLRCRLCGLRMWGEPPPHRHLHCCQPTHQRSANPPAGHPKTVYLNEAKLNTALFGYLRGALFGPDRIEYWSRYLEAAAAPQPELPGVERIKAVHAEIADRKSALADVRPLPGRLPILAASLHTLPQHAIRNLIEQLNLDVVYQPDENAFDVTLTLADQPGAGASVAPSATNLRSTDPVPPAGFEPAPPPPEGGALSPELRGPGNLRLAVQV